MGGYSDVVVNESCLSTACTAAASDDDIYFLEGGTEREAHHQPHLPHGLWCGRGRMTFSSRDRHSSAVVFRGGSWTRLR